MIKKNNCYILSKTLITLIARIMSQTTTTKKRPSPTKERKEKAKQIRFSEIRSLKEKELISQFGPNWESKLVIKIKKILDPEHQCMAMAKKLVKGGGPIFCRCSRRFVEGSFENTGHKLCKLHSKLDENGEYKYKKMGLYTDPPPVVQSRASGPPCRALVKRKNKDTKRDKIVQCGLRCSGDNSICTRCSKPWTDKNGDKKEFKIATKYNNKVPVYPEFKWQCYGTIDNKHHWVEDERERLSRKKKRKTKKTDEMSIYDTAVDDAECDAAFDQRLATLRKQHEARMKLRSVERNSSDKSVKSEKIENISSTDTTTESDSNDAESDADSDLSADDE